MSKAVAISKMSKEDILAELELAKGKVEGLEFSEENTAAELKEMLKDVREALGESKDEEVAEGEAFDVVMGNQYIRTYEAPIHEDPKTLAEQFVGKNEKRGMAVEAAGKITTLTLNWREEVLDRKTKERTIENKTRAFPYAEREAALSVKAQLPTSAKAFIEWA